MMGEGHAPDWEYGCVGPADSFQELVGELKAKAEQGWEVAGVSSDSSKVYATVKRALPAMAVQGQKAA